MYHSSTEAAAAFFFGVAAFFEAAAFLGPVDFFATATGLAVVLVTRPDLVLPRTLGTSTTAGACEPRQVSTKVRRDGSLTEAGALRLVAVFALGFATAFSFLGAAAFLVAGALGLAFSFSLVAVFFGAASFLVALVVVGF